MSNTTIDKELYDAVVVGGGPAGLTAALYLGRARYRVLVIEREKFGGQITITAEVVNYPGARPQSGEELANQMKSQAESFGAEFMKADVTSLEMDADVKIVHTSRGDIRALGVLLATGAHPRIIGFSGEKEYQGRGVAYCATCDGEFFTDREVFVIGGGFAAAEESVFLTRYASHVTVLVRGDDFACAKEVADKTRSNPKITVLTNTEVDSVEGDALIKRITWHNNKTGEIGSFTPEDGGTFGVFVFAGYVPSTDLVQGLADLTPQGYVVTNEHQQTCCEGLFAAGDVCVKDLRQCITAAGEAAQAASSLERYLSAQREKTGLATEMAARPFATHDASGSEASENAPASGNDSGSIFDDNMRSQLKTVFGRMQGNLVLEVYYDNRQVSADLKEYMNALSEMTDKIALREHPQADQAGNDDAELPFVRVMREDGTPAGITFHGAPGGHEFTSFVLGLYNAAGPGQPVEEEVRTQIGRIDRKIPVKILVSLSCTMCPELVTSAGRIATLNPNVSVDVYDIAHFPGLKDKYNVMSVPCFVLGDGDPKFGKKSVGELVEYMR